MEIKPVTKGRQQYCYNDNPVYEWEQTLEDVFVYIKTPECLLDKFKDEIKKSLKPGQQLPKLEVVFTPKHLTVSLKGFPAYLDEDTAHNIKHTDCLWQRDGEEITITLVKAIKADTWMSVFKNHDQSNVFQKEEMQKKMLLERFQEEHGGFDFSDAEINGNVPDPKTFMGGINL